MVVCLYGGTISLYSFCPKEKQGSNFYIKKYFFNHLFELYNYPTFATYDLMIYKHN